MLNPALVFIATLFIATGVLGSFIGGLLLALLAAGAFYLLSKKAAPAVEAVFSSGRYGEQNSALKEATAPSMRHDTQQSSHSSTPLSLESRVNALEQQVLQLKKQLLEVISSSVSTTTNSAAAASQPATASRPLDAHISVATLPSSVFVDGVTNTTLSESSTTYTATTVTAAPLSKAYLDSRKDEQTTDSSASLDQASSEAVKTPAPYVPHIPPGLSTTPYVAPPPKPSVIETLIQSGVKVAKNWLLGGNTLVRVGIIILFFGVAFWLKYAADNDYIPIELRLLAVGLLGMALVGVGFRARNTADKKGFSYAMQGGGVGVLYLTIFAAFKLYSLIPQGFTFGLLAGVAFASAGLAVLQSALALAILGFAGGFLAPILISTGGGSHVGLFSYYLVLNLGIAFVAYFRGWRVLNVMGFAFTFVIGTLWGVQKYTPELFASTEPFLIAHGLIYTFIAIAYAFKRAPSAKDYVDATLVFGTPLVGFGLQYGLLKDSPFGMAYSALALGGYYMALAWWVLTRKRATLKFLGECFLALAVGFATLAIPLSLDGRWTSASWALEGVALLWVGLKQARFLPTAAGLALQVLGAFMFIKGWGLTGSQGADGQNMFLGAAFIALSGLACGALLLRHSRLPASNARAQDTVNTKTSTEASTDSGDTLAAPTVSQRLYDKASELAPVLSTASAAWGWAWLMLSGAKGISAWIGDEKPFLEVLNPFMLFIVVTGLALYTVARKLSWPMLRTLSFTALPALVGTTAYILAPALLNNSWQPPSALLGWLCLPVAVVTYWFMLRRDKAVPDTVQHGVSQSLGISASWLWQSPLLWVVSALSVLEINHRLAQWSEKSMPVALAIEGAVLVWLGLRSVQWLPKAVVNPWVMVLAGLAVQILASLMYVWHELDRWQNNLYWQGAVIGSAIWLSSYLIKGIGKKLSIGFTVLGWLMWLFAGYVGLNRIGSSADPKLYGAIVDHWMMVYIAVLSIAIYWLGRRLAWSSMWKLSFAVLPFIGLGVLMEGLNRTPLADHGWLGWPAILITLPLLLYWHGKVTSSNTDSRALAASWAFATGWLWRAPWLWALAWLSMRQAFGFTAQHASGDWPILAGLAASFVVVMLTMRLKTKAAPPQDRNWVAMACGPVIACLLGYSIYATLNLAGDTPPLPYITLLNPLELGLLGIVMLAGLWLKSMKTMNSGHLVADKASFFQELLPQASKMLVALGFIWLNSVLLRSLHHYADVPYLWTSVLNNTVARAAFTLLWSLSALGLMLYAHKKTSRTLWIIGATLMVVVVAKLFLLDLSGRGTVERIVSFMGAGILLLVMGYFAPLPPSTNARANAAPSKTDTPPTETV